MSEFIRAAVSDMHAGRETWRVRITLSLPAFMMAIAISLIRLA